MSIIYKYICVYISYLETVIEALLSLGLDVVV